MPDLQAEWLSVKLLACVIFASAIIALLFVLVYFGRENFAQTFVKAMVVALPAAARAYVAGYLTGISRSPAVGTVLPAVLAAGATIYFASMMRVGEAQNCRFSGWSLRYSFTTSTTCPFWTLGGMQSYEIRLASCRASPAPIM